MVKIPVGDESGKKKERKEEKEEKKTEKCRVLALGMAFVRPEVAAEAVKNVAAGTTNASARDQARLAALETLLGCTITSMNLDTSEDLCAPGKHYRGQFAGGRRAARSLFPGVCGANEPFSIVVTDWFRFPIGYMRAAYASLIPFLKALSECGALHPDVVIWLPNAEEGLWDVDIEGKEEDNKKKKKKFVAVEALAEENPLFRATAVAQERVDAGAIFGALSNASEIKPLRPCPFLRVKLR